MVFIIIMSYFGPFVRKFLTEISLSGIRLHTIAKSRAREYR